MSFSFVIPDSGQEHGGSGAKTEQNVGTHHGWDTNTLLDTFTPRNNVAQPIHPHQCSGEV